MLDQYVFEGTKHEAELQRLRALEQAFDLDSRRVLLRTGLSAGWCCVEVGAGAGSIAKWISEVVGVRGQVTAIDTNARFLSGLSQPNLRVIETDVRHVVIEPSSADLVHARFVLIHQSDYLSVVEAMVRFLKPGGWLVLEEPDFSMARALTGSSTFRAAFASVALATEAMFAQRGMNHSLGAGIPELLQGRGLDEIAVEADAPIDRGGGPIARMMAMSTRQLRDIYLATGQATANDVDLYLAFAADPSCWATYHGVVRGAGKRPGTPFVEPPIGVVGT